MVEREKDENIDEEGDVVWAARQRMETLEQSKQAETEQTLHYHLERTLSHVAVC